MHCENCGAPMRKVKNADYYVCDYCFTFKYPESDKTLEGVASLHEVTEHKCPVCSSNLNSGILYDEKVLFCENCKGILLKMSSFTSVVEKIRSINPFKIPDLKKISQEELNRRTKCPLCGKIMDTHPYYGPSRTVVDTCLSCSVIWLDSGELTRIITSV